MKSSKRAKARKRRDFPLFPHPAGYWAKKIAGKHHYFGKVADDPEGRAALEEWLRVKDALLAGRPRPSKDQPIGLSVKGLCDHFLGHKDSLKESGELAPRTFNRYYATCVFLADTFGRDRLVDSLTPDDFQLLRNKMAALWGPVALGNEIQIVRSVFKYGFEAGLMDKPVRFGPGFKKPSAKTLRLNRARGGPRVFEPAQIKAMLAVAPVNFKAMLLLALNGGLGNSDLAELPIAALDLERGWLDYPRVKTGVPRRIPLWPETVAAIRAVIAQRQEPRDPNEAHLLFIGPSGKSYVSDHKGTRVNGDFRRCVVKAKLDGSGLTFYDCRRTFQTIAEGVPDLVAVKHIMGHAPASGDMSAIYRQRIDDDRLVAVVNYVRTWLYGIEETK